MTASYESFVSNKLSLSPATGMMNVPPLTDHLFPFQKDLVTWALRRGRAAIFAATGLGKTRQELVYADTVARHTGGRVLLLTPLAVASQTAEEATRIGVRANVCREPEDVDAPVAITNYDRLHKFEASAFSGVVLDESSVIKHHNSKTFDALTRAFDQTPFKLCATATPAPNDYTELGTHAEFLGVCSRSEMLAEYFVHDGGSTQDWRLKGHGRAMFWRWVSSWGALVRRPSDLGYEDGAYNLPPLTVSEHTIASDLSEAHASGSLFVQEAGSLSERRAARKVSVGRRVAECAAMVNADLQPWLVWCDLNSESDALTKSIGGAVEVRGSMTVDEKEDAIARFIRGDARVLVSKPSICGWGLNLQFCRRMAFVGVTDSFEAYYQAIRRCWRFGQSGAVDVHVFASEAEGAVVANLRRKEADALRMGEELARETSEMVRAEVRGLSRDTNAYAPRVPMDVPHWIRTEDVA